MCRRNRLDLSNSLMVTSIITTVGVKCTPADPYRPATTLQGRPPGVQCWAGPPRPCRMIWNPTQAFIESTNVWRFMQRLGFDDREAFLRFSRENPERFWDEMMREMRVEWFEPYRQVLDASRGPEWTQWFIGGRLNIAHNCLDRWAESDRVACLWEAENGAAGAVTFREVRDQANRVANGLRALGLVEPATAWRSACRWFRRSSPSCTAASRRGSPWCRSSRASARARSPRAWRIRARACCSPRISWSGAANAFRWPPRCRLSAVIPSCCARPPGTISSAPSRPNRRLSRSIPKRAPSSSTPRAPRASPRAPCTPTPDAWRKWARRSGWASTTATTTASSGSATSAG